MTNIEQIHDLSVELWHEYADENIKSCGYPSIYGPTSSVEWSVEEGMLKGAIAALSQVVNKIESDRKSKCNKL